MLALLFLGLRALYARLRDREGLGLGDVKLAAVAGAWLDWPMIPVAIEIAAFAALSIYVLRNFVRKRPMRAAACCLSVCFSHRRLALLAAADDIARSVLNSKAVGPPAQDVSGRCRR